MELSQVIIFEFLVCSFIQPTEALLLAVVNGRRCQPRPEGPAAAGRQVRTHSGPGRTGRPRELQPGDLIGAVVCSPDRKGLRKVTFELTLPALRP